jgi:hypothetical protein
MALYSTDQRSENRPVLHTDFVENVGLINTGHVPAERLQKAVTNPVKCAFVSINNGKRARCVASRTQGFIREMNEIAKCRNISCRHLEIPISRMKSARRRSRTPPQLRVGLQCQDSVRLKFHSLVIEEGRQK